MKFKIGDQVVIVGPRHYVYNVERYKPYEITGARFSVRGGDYYYEILNDGGTKQVFTAEDSDIILLDDWFRDRFFLVGDRIVIENHDDHPFNAVSLGGIYEVRGWDEYNEKLWIKNDTGAPQVFSEQRYFYNGFKLFDVGVIDNREVEKI